MDTRTRYRTAFAAVVLLSAVFLAGTNVSSATEHPLAEFREQSELPVGDREQLAPPRDGVTVVTSHLGDAGNIMALNRNGTVLYHNETHDGYWDVDPSPRGERTVVYSATHEVRDTSLCKPVDNEDYCIRQMIERVNLTTGEVSVLYSRIDPRYHSSEWHDVDRINESHYVVADMYANEVFIVNVSSGIVVWEWNLQNHSPLTSGGPFPEDWAHLNDVEVLDDGRIMVSLRNHDQVVFVDRRHGVIDNWTLGADGRHDTLYEQHNPDYIPRSNGGPAIVIADSENNRIVEYQRTSAGEWNQTWIWQDDTLQWGRDADRLPDGHTLVTDTHGGRVIELDKQGEIVWRIDVPVAYEAERLNTGDESTEGPSATKADLRSRILSGTQSTEQSNVFVRVKNRVKGSIPNKIINSVSYLTPSWVGFYDLVALLIGILAASTWIGFEIRWSNFRLQKPIIRE